MADERIVGTELQVAQRRRTRLHPPAPHSRTAAHVRCNTHMRTPCYYLIAPDPQAMQAVELVSEAAPLSLDMRWPAAPSGAADLPLWTALFTKNAAMFSLLLQLGANASLEVGRRRRCAVLLRHLVCSRRCIAAPPRVHRRLCCKHGAQAVICDLCQRHALTLLLYLTDRTALARHPHHHLATTARVCPRRSNRRRRR
jgi:hypothetical protein